VFSMDLMAPKGVRSRRVTLGGGDGAFDSGAVSLRSVPYPYRAMLALCSDLDETPDCQIYWKIVRFLNSTNTTSMGPGLGLEVGNSIYFDTPPGQFSYWNTDDAGRTMIRRLIRSGHVDCLHSYGDLATTRAHAGRALDELSRHGCTLEVWVDHAVAPSNFGPDIMRGWGDVAGCPSYHADLTLSFGVQYVWRGRVTSVTGQEVPRDLRGIFHRRHPLLSARTLVKEWLKGLLSSRHDAKYALHGPNRLLRHVQLRDGGDVVEFIRANPYWGGVDRGETANGLADVLCPPVLHRLMERGGVCVLYTHLGKRTGEGEPFPPRTQAALRQLARHSRDRDILVTTTRRLLGYCRMLREVTFSFRGADDGLTIELFRSNQGPVGATSTRDVSGLTLYVPDAARARVMLNGSMVTRIERNRADHTGRQSVSIPWPRLDFSDS
jgi:hypothetical protein